MRIGFCGDDFFLNVVRSLRNNGHEISHIWYPERDNVYLHNTGIKNFAEEVGASLKEGAIAEHEIDNRKFDALIVAAYPHKVPVNQSSLYAINIHPSVLPNGRGPWPLPWFILKEEKSAGVTIHKVSPLWDQGDILTQVKFPLSPRENLETLSAKVKLAAEALAIETIKKLDYYWNRAKPQGVGTKWVMPSWDNDRTILWSMPVEQIDRMSRAFGKMDVGAFFEGKNWIVKNLSVWEETHSFEPGSVVVSEPSMRVIAALDGFVCLRFFDRDPDDA